MPSFMLRQIDPELWARVHARALVDGLTIKQAVLRALHDYAQPQTDAEGYTHPPMGKRHICGKEGYGFACPICEVIEDQNDRMGCRPSERRKDARP